MTEQVAEQVTEKVAEGLKNVSEALQLDDIREKAVDPLFEQWQVLLSFLPKVAAALVVLFIGCVIGYLISRFVASLLRRFGIDRLSRSAGVDSMMSERGLKSKPSKLIGKMVFWFIAFTAFIPATEILGIKELVELTQTFVLFLPKIIAAFIILMFGFVVANFLRQSVQGSKSRLGLSSTKAVGGMVYGLAVAVTVVVALGQLDLDTRLLHTVLITVIASLCAAIALAVGLGGRELAHNLVAGFYARESFQPGDQVVLGKYAGTLLEIRAQNTVLEIESGQQVSIPNSLLFQQIVRTEKQKM